MRTIFLFLALATNAFATDLLIFDIEHKQFLSKEEFLEDSAQSDLFIFGENHYHHCIQQAEAEVISWIAKDRDQEFTVGMEFIDYDKQSETEYWSIEYQSGAIGLREFTEKLIGKKDRDLLYSPILREAILNGGKVLGTNSPRDIKSKLMKDGYDSIPSEYKTEQFFDGTATYFSRFKKAMEGHANEEQIQKYFLAQVYTDNYIAEKVLTKSRTNLDIQVIGSFHSDYFDGFINQVEQRAQRQITSVKFLEMKDMYPYMNEDSRYGRVSKYLIGCKK